MKRVFLFAGLFLALSMAPFAAAAPVKDAPHVRIGEPASDGAAGAGLCFRGCGGVHVPVQSAAYEQHVAELVNQERATRGMPPLKVVWELAEAARYHAADMAQDDYFEHDSYDGSSRVCSWSQRIATYYPNYQSLAENIAAGYGTPQQVMAGWMSSEGHRANILSTGSWEIGVGYYAGGGSYGTYWAQDFGRRVGQYPLVINREAASTDSLAVALYLYGDWAEMRLRNDGGAWTDWRPFAHTLGWTLSPSVGQRTVSAEMRSGTRSAAAEDTIYLSQAPARLGDLPERLEFLASASEQRVSPGAYVAILQNVASGAPISWRASTDVAWLALSQTTGNTPGSLWIAYQGPVPAGPQTLRGTVRVEVSAPTDATGTPQEIDVVLHVAPGPLLRAYLPHIER